MHFRLFDRPLIVDGQLGTMYITGLYDDYDPGSAYEGRVNILGSVGLCKVEILDNNLPPGAYAYVDNVLKQVVVKWPKYTPPVDTFTLLENGDFSNGDDGSWTNTGEGKPFSIGLDSSGQNSLMFKSGFSGGHWSESVLAPVENINKQITATGRIAQGKSSKRKMWGGIVLVFHDKDRKYLNHVESNWVNSGGDYKDVTVTAAPTNALTKFVSVRVHFDRKGQNHPAWANDIKWNHVWTKGYDSDAPKYVTVRVTDSLNNTATHTGYIEERSIWFTSQLYPHDHYEYTSMGSVGFTSVRLSDQPTPVEYLGMGSIGFVMGDLRDNTVTIPAQSDYIGMGTTSFVSGALRNVVVTMPAQSDYIGMGTTSFVSGTHRVAVVATTYTDYIGMGTTSFISGTLT